MPENWEFTEKDLGCHIDGSKGVSHIMRELYRIMCECGIEDMPQRWYWKKTKHNDKATTQRWTTELISEVLKSGDPKKISPDLGEILRAHVWIGWYGTRDLEKEYHEKHGQHPPRSHPIYSGSSLVWIWEKDQFMLVQSPYSNPIQTVSLGEYYTYPRLTSLRGTDKETLLSSQLLTIREPWRREK
jgi:hypothetical protein